MPAADEVHRLQTGKDPEALLFQKVAEQGHYAGRTKPTTTRQGIYAATPSGVLLASINSNSPEQVKRMLERALDKWKNLPADERLLGADWDGSSQVIPRAERFFPGDGLVLSVVSRDMPRPETAEDWRGNAWNQDYAWFRADEAKQFLPDTIRPGARRDLPVELVQRIARLHLPDNVRGQTIPFEARHIESAVMESVVTGVRGNLVDLRLEGHVRARAEGTWSVAGFADMNNPTNQQRGFDGRLLGFATYDTDVGRFTSLEMIALGERRGATQYNGRSDDPGPAPQAFLFTLAGNSPAERVAPAFFGSYGWR